MLPDAVINLGQMIAVLLKLRLRLSASKYNEDKQDNDVQSIYLYEFVRS